MTQRFFVYRKPPFDFEANRLLNELQTHLAVPSLRQLQHYLVYTVQNVEKKLLNASLDTVFCEPVFDNIRKNLVLKGSVYLAFEPLPRQHNPRAVAVEKLLTLQHPGLKPAVKTGQVYVFNSDLSEADFVKIKSFVLNPLENREFNLRRQMGNALKAPMPLEMVANFRFKTRRELQRWIKTQRLSISLADLQVIQQHFQKIGREPTHPELQFFDAYWSDHCRHTTFNTQIPLTNIEIQEASPQFRETFKMYLQDEVSLGRPKAFTLMDLATVNSRLATASQSTQVRSSAETNAAGINLVLNGENYTLVVKNETHNHPTEIEPEGGAATCLGGAIRDILASRAPAIAGLRVSACPDPTAFDEPTPPHKLSRVKIAVEAARGFANYGNQVGLPTMLVEEYYDPSYWVKHLECGAVVGFTKTSAIQEATPVSGDLVVLIGGPTGIDGVGAASGSSKAHTTKSLNRTNEVQKGNPLLARKMQRLWSQNPDFVRLFKKVNDFGAGGIAVCCAELAPGVHIQLDKVRTKYKQMSAAEILLSESQERMAVVIDPKNLETVVKTCAVNGLPAYEIGEITADNHFLATFRSQQVVNLSQQILAMNGASRIAKVEINELPGNLDPFGSRDLITAATLKENLQIVTSQIPLDLVMMFDSSVGANTHLAPFGGHNQLTKEQVGAHFLPLSNTETNHLVVSSCGFTPQLGKKNPYLMGQMAVVTLISKLVANGVKPAQVIITLQEYFPTLGNDPQKWSWPVMGLLGAYRVMRELNLVAAGGKDSMSGTYENHEVTPGIIAFGFAHHDRSQQRLIPTPFQKTNSVLVLLTQKYTAAGEIDFDHYQKILNRLMSFEKEGLVRSASALENKTIWASLINMAVGNQIGFKVNGDCLLKVLPGSFLLEMSEMPADHADLIQLGLTQNNPFVVANNLVFDLAKLTTLVTKPLQRVYAPQTQLLSSGSEFALPTIRSQPTLRPLRLSTCRVLVPIFDGTNSEYDLGYAFQRSGATVTWWQFRDEPGELARSLQEFARLIRQCDVLALAGGFVFGDEPAGAAKLIASILTTSPVKKALTDHLQERKLILGICNGFQGLLKAGLLPEPFVPPQHFNLAVNAAGNHVARLARIVLVARSSPWLGRPKVGSKLHEEVLVSHGEGRFICDSLNFKQLLRNKQIFSFYANQQGNIDTSYPSNFNGSSYAIEGLVSANGLILGRMGHPERYYSQRYVNALRYPPVDLFRNAVDYIKKGHSN